MTYHFRPYLASDGVIKTHFFLRRILEIIVEFGFTFQSILLSEVLLQIFDHSTSYYCKIRHPLPDSMKIALEKPAATHPVK